MARGEEGGGGLYGVLTFIAVAMLVAVVILSIRTYDRDDEGASVPVAAGQTAGQTAAQPAPESPQIATEPVGGVATGGGGTAAGDSGSMVLPVFAGLVALTLLAATGFLWRPRRGSTPA